MFSAETGELRGHNLDVFLELASNLNLSYSFLDSVDHKFGTLEADGETFNGLVGMVQRGEIDFVVADLSSSPQRGLHVDHLYPIYDYYHSMLYWRPDAKVGWSKYGRVFTPPFWGALAVTAAVLAGALWAALGWAGTEEGGGGAAGRRAAEFVLACGFNK